MGLFRVVEDDSQRMSMAAAKPTYAVPHVYPIHTAGTLHGTMVHGEYHSVSLVKRYYFGTRLHAGTLFGEYKFTTGKVLPGLRQQDCDLEWENVFAVKVLV